MNGQVKPAQEKCKETETSSSNQMINIVLVTKSKISSRKQKIETYAIESLGMFPKAAMTVFLEFSENFHLPPMSPAKAITP